MGGKNSAGGPIWVVEQNKLFDTLKNEQEYFDDLLNNIAKELPEELQTLFDEQLREIRKISTIWNKLYHCLVFLNAALDSPGLNSVNWYLPNAELDSEGDNDYDPCNPMSYKTTPWVSGGTDELGWLGGYNLPEFEQHFQTSEIVYCEGGDESIPDTPRSLIDIFKSNFVQSDLESRVQNLADDDEFYETLAQFSPTGPATSKPLLEIYLTEFQNFNQNFSDFDPNECLRLCLESTSQFKAHDNTSSYVETALGLIAELWSEDAADDLPRDVWQDDFNSWGEAARDRLKEVSTWLTALNDDIEFKSWLRKQYRLSSPDSAQSRDLLSETITSNNATAKLIVVGMMAMLEVNETALWYIYKRCFGGSSSHPYDTLEKIIDQDLEEYGENWNSLRNATYGAIIWHILHQVTPTMQRLRQVLEAG